MKKLITTVVVLLNFLPLFANISKNHESDTVIIELNNKSKIIVYTEDRVALKELEKYDLNQMIKDLNSALGSNKIKRIELQDENGQKYLKDTTLIFGETNGAKTRIKIGKMELFVDADDWEENLENQIEEEIELNFRNDNNDKTSKRTENDVNLEIGMNNWIENGHFPDETNKSYAVKPWGSWYFAINSMNKSWITGPLVMDWGAGISWYNWSLQDPSQLISQANTIELNTAPSENTSLKSRLQAPYINITMVPMLDFEKGKKKIKDPDTGKINFESYKNHSLRFGVGGYAGYRVGGNTKYVYEVDGKKHKDKNSDNYYLSNFRYGVRAQFGFKDFDMFAQYDLNDVFAKNKGPASSPGLNAFTFGIIL